VRFFYLSFFIKGEVCVEKTSVKKTDDGIVVVTINRPSVRNAIDYDVMDQLNIVINEVREDKSCKALVITGEGEQAFCSGGDLAIFSELHTENQAYLMLSKMGNILYKLMTLNRPTVALINGTSIGGGLELATACDFRIARSNGTFGFVQGRLAITTGWDGGSFLYEKMPHHHASKLLYSKKKFSAEFGKEIGFIDYIMQESNWKEEGISWVEELVKNSSPLVLAAYKAIVIRKWESSDLEQRVVREIEQCSKLWALKEHHEDVNMFLSKGNS
jgi:enoyl-CoA hydratase